MSTTTISSTRHAGWEVLRPRSPSAIHPRRLLACALIACAAFALPSIALAQSSSVPSTATAPKSGNANLKNAVLLSTAGTRATVGPLDSVIHASLERLAVVKVSGRPGMDLNAVQLAIDCVNETPQCLRAVAKQTGAEVLIAPSLQSTPSELVLSVLRFDMADERMRRVVRRQPGTTLKPETLDAVPGMLRELFGIPEPAPKPAAPPPVAATEPEAEPATELPPIVEPPQEPTHRSMPVGPWLLAGGGALVIGGGAVAGALFLGNQDKYNALRPRNDRQVDDAVALRTKAETQATVATVLFGVGGAMVVAGGIWLAVALSQPSGATDYDTALIPSFGPNEVGLTFVHRGGAL